MACKQALRGALAEGQEKASSTVMLICWEKKATGTGTNRKQKEKKLKNKIKNQIIADSNT